MVKILQNFVAFSEYMNFTQDISNLPTRDEFELDTLGLIKHEGKQFEGKRNDQMDMHLLVIIVFK